MQHDSVDERKTNVVPVNPFTPKQGIHQLEGVPCLRRESKHRRPASKRRLNSNEDADAGAGRDLSTDTMWADAARAEQYRDEISLPMLHSTDKRDQQEATEYIVSLAYMQADSLGDDNDKTRATARSEIPDADDLVCSISDEEEDHFDESDNTYSEWFSME